MRITLLTLLFTFSAIASDPSCKDPSQVVELSKSNAEAWSKSIVYMMQDALLCTNASSQDLQGSCVIAGIVHSDVSTGNQNDGVFSKMHLQNEDRIYGNETQRVTDSMSVLQIFTSIFRGQAECLKIERADGTLSVLKYKISN